MKVESYAPESGSNLSRSVLASSYPLSEPLAGGLGDCAQIADVLEVIGFERFGPLLEPRYSVFDLCLRVLGERRSPGAGMPCGLKQAPEVRVLT